MKRSRFLALLASVTMSGAIGAAAQEAGQPLLVAAASDLKFALDDVLVEFAKAHPEHRAKVSYASSGTLYAQIDNGAPFDLFLSADVKFPRQLGERGKADAASLFPYAIGHLVVWVPKSSKIEVEKLGIQAVLDPAARKVAIANPDVAPYGAAAQAALKSLGVYDAVKPRLVLGENIAQTTQFVQSGAADIGLISLSLALAPKMKDAGRMWHVPVSAFPRLEQAGIICARATNRRGAEELRAFLQAPAGKAVLKRYGFELPEDGN